MISVGAIDFTGSLSFFSSYGAQAEITAPGEDIYSTVKDGTHAYMSGTSMAAPHVSGMLALMKEKYPGDSNAELRNKLTLNARDTGIKGWDPMYGHGLLQGDLGYYKALPTKEAVKENHMWKITYNQPVDFTSADEKKYLCDG